MYTLILWIEYMIRKTNVWDKQWYTLEEFAQRTYMARKPDFTMAILADVLVVAIICITIVVVMYAMDKKASSKAEG